MTVEDRARAIANDRDGGASELLARLLPLLDEVIRTGREATEVVARIVCRGQPAMAALWNACAAAIADDLAPGLFARRRDEMQRAPRALARAASGALIDLLDREPGRLVLTVSYSGGVADALIGAATQRSFEVVCAEGRPRYEGRRLASRLADAGIAVRVVTDAALSSYLADAQAFACGADALLPTGWINKVGTGAVASAASRVGVPTYVVAARDKAADVRWASASIAAAGAASEVWDAAPTGVTVENRSFELIPAELATLFLTDAGRVAPDDLIELIPARGQLDRLMALLAR